jgi:hypothetical protein
VDILYSPPLTPLILAIPAIVALGSFAGASRLRGGLPKLLLVAVAVIAAAGTVAGACLFCLFPPSSCPPPVRDLARGRGSQRDSDLSSAFNKWVQSAFPGGAPEADLRTALWSRGFYFAYPPGPLRSPPGPLRSCTTAAFPCGTYWIVSWQTNSSGAVAKVRGRVNTVCL